MNWNHARLSALALSCGDRAFVMALQKLPPFVYQFYPYPNYPRIPGVQVDLFWNGSESEVYNAVWRGHDGGNALKDEVTPTPQRLQTWLAR